LFLTLGIYTTKGKKKTIIILRFIVHERSDKLNLRRGQSPDGEKVVDRLNKWDVRRALNVVRKGKFLTVSGRLFS